LRFKLGGVNRLRIQVQSRARLFEGTVATYGSRDAKGEPQRPDSPQIADGAKRLRINRGARVNWTHVWRRLNPWPDSVEGLSRLKKKYIISPMSNGNVALMTSLAKFGGLPWDLILGSDLVKHYKLDRETYLSAPFYLDLKPEEVMMCAAHVGDLQAARSYGLRTGFICRPNEYGGGSTGVPDKARPDDFDVVSVSIMDLAQQMGA
jgi:2-haloacid dehalogenase